MASKYRRKTLYPATLNVKVDAATRDMVAMEAEAEGCSEAAIVRECLAAELPRLRDRNRKRRSAERKNHRNGG